VWEKGSERVCPAEEISLATMFHSCYIRSSMRNGNFFDERWVTVPRRDVPGPWQRSYVSLNRKGEIVIGSITHRELGSPEAYLVHLDRYTQRLALEPATLETKNAYPARVTGSSGAKRLTVRRLVTKFGIQTPDTVQFEDIKVIEGGTMVLDLKKIRISGRAHSQCRRSAKSCQP